MAAGDEITPLPQGSAHVPITLTGGTNTSVGTTDEDGNLYVIGDHATGLLLRKYNYANSIDPDTGAYLAGPGTIAWEDNPLPGTSGSAWRGLGVVYNGWVYSWGTEIGGSATGWMWRHAGGGSEKPPEPQALGLPAPKPAEAPAFPAPPQLPLGFGAVVPENVAAFFDFLNTGSLQQLQKKSVRKELGVEEVARQTHALAQTAQEQLAKPGGGTTAAPVTGTTSRIDGTLPWLTTADNILPWTDMSISFNTQLALAKDVGLLGLVANDGANGLRLRLINAQTGATAATTTINVANNLGASDITSDGTNFYVAWAATAGQPNRLSKFDSSGTLAWTLTGSTRLYGVSFDFLSQQLYAVGDDIGGSGFTVAQIDPADGSVDDGSNVSSQVWTSVRATGRGTWAIGRSGVISLISGDGAFTVLATVSVPGFSGYGIVLANGGESSKSPTGTGGGSGNRVTRLLGTSKGTVTCFDQKGLVPVINGTEALSPQRAVIFSAQLGSHVYFADGISTRRYSIASNTVEAWTASAGSLPVAGSLRPTLIENWRGRLVQAGIASDAHNWFMSRQGDARDYDYGQTDVQSAVAGNNARAGLSPDIIMALLPYSDDLLVFGCDHSIWKMTGDPMSGGRFDCISDTIGMAWGRPYCRDAVGVIYFMSSRGRVYRMAPYGSPEPISMQIDQRLAKTDLASKIVRMAWDDEENGFYMTLSPTARNQATIHYFFDAKVGGWWPDVFHNVNHNPRVVYVYDGDESNDRRILLGCNDGYVRTFSENVNTDDNELVSSFVYIGPFQSATDAVLLKEIQAILTQGRVDWSVHVGDCALSALGAVDTASGTIFAGRNHSQPCRRFGHSIYLKLSNSILKNRWVLEHMQARIQTVGGAPRQRMF